MYAGAGDLDELLPRHEDEHVPLVGRQVDLRRLLHRSVHVVLNHVLAVYL